MHLQVSGQLVDALGQDSDLHFGGAGVGLVGTVGLDNGGLLVFQHHSCVSTFLELRPHPEPWERWIAPRS